MIPDELMKRVSQAQFKPSCSKRGALSIYRRWGRWWLGEITQSPSRHTTPKEMTLFPDGLVCMRSNPMSGYGDEVRVNETVFHR
jgi:hypothetical protein